jgi:hypothetical protein
MEPLLGALGSVAICLDVCFELCNPILSCAQLMRQLLRRLQRVFTVSFGNISGFVNQLQDHLARRVELISVAGCGILTGTRECNGVGPVAGKLTMHRRPSLLTGVDLTADEAVGGAYARRPPLFVLSCGGGATSTLTFWDYRLP